jgi:hypothetical protein
MKNVSSASDGKSGGDSLETCWTPGGHGRFVGDRC